MYRWLITGANGNLGRRLLADLLADGNHSAIAVVRSERARDQILRDDAIPHESEALRISVLDYSDADALADAAVGCERAVHLVGILKQTRSASYFDAHEGSCRALTSALDGSSVEHLTYLSIVGSRPDAANACLASKGRAEQICLQSRTPTCVLRVPMVLGEGDYASASLRARASAGRSFTFRATSMEQPIYAGDVVKAIRAAARMQVQGDLDLAGPEALSRRELTARAGRVLGTRTAVVSLPLAVGYGLAWLMERLLANPPLTAAMLGVLDHDDQVDSGRALAALGLDGLTGLDDMLAAVLADS